MIFLEVGFLGDNWRDALALAGLGVTAVAFAITIWRVLVVGGTARAAQSAVETMKDQVSRNFQLTEVSAATQLIGEILALADAENYDGVRLRLRDLRALLVRIAEPRPKNDKAEAQNLVAQVASLEDEIVRSKHGRGKAVGMVRVQGQLVTISDWLNSLVTGIRIEAGGQ